MWKLTVRGYEKGKKYNSRKGRFSYFGSGLVTERGKKEDLREFNVRNQSRQSRFIFFSFSGRMDARLFFPELRKLWVNLGEIAAFFRALGRTATNSH